MILNNLLYNRQADAASSPGGIPGCICPVKTIKNIRHILHGDSLSVIRDLHLDKISHILDLYADMPLRLIHIFYGISDNIVNHPLQLLRTEKNLAASMERLSSGYKINHASDNPAGMAISNKMKAQIDALDQAESNSTDGVSVLQIADGALNEVSSMLQRVRELSVQAANGTNSESERQAIQDEINQLTKEVDRISSDTEYNTKTLLDGSSDVRVYTENADRVYISDGVASGKYELNVDLDAASVTLNVQPDPNKKDGFSQTAQATIDGDRVKITDIDGFSMDFQVGASGDVSLEVTDIGAMTIQLGANENQTMDIRIPEISSQSLYLDTVNVVTEEGAGAAITTLDGAISRLSEVRSRIGASQNRLEYATNSLSETSENMTSAFSNLVDTDMAKEMTEYTQQNILDQASISVLSQANDIPQQILSLLSR